MWYLQMLKRNEPGCTIVIKPELPKKKTLEEQYKTVKENSSNYDMSIWILDLDTVLKESREGGRSSMILKELQQYLTEFKKNDKVKVLINNPCLEFWFLLHFTNTGKYYPQCDPISTQLRKNDPLKNYAKTSKFFTSPANDIYKLLKPYQPNAYRNASILKKLNLNEPEKASAEIFKLIDILGLST